MIHILYVTTPSIASAKKISRHLLSKKLIACANIFLSDSLSPWKGKLEQKKEGILLIKTNKKNLAQTKKEIEKIHPYDIPCIIELPVNANKAYVDWVNSVVA